MNKVKKYLAALLLTLPLLVGFNVTTAPAANALAGCTSQVQLRADNWSENVGYWGLNYPSRQPDFFVIRLTATTAYWYCPNGADPNKVKPVWADFCWSHITPSSGADNFTGASFNPYYYDNNEITNPPTTVVDDDGSAQNCRTYNIPAADEKWFEMQQNPRWKVTAWVKLYAWPDHERVFDWNGNSWKPFVPSDDVALSGWRW